MICRGVLQHHGEGAGDALVDELEDLGYVTRLPDPTDRRAKLIVLTSRGRAAVQAGKQTIIGIEARIDEVVGKEGHALLRKLLAKLLEAEG